MGSGLLVMEELADNVFQALAPGSPGRPYVYALAIAGQRGVEEVIRNLKADFALGMALSGCAAIGEIKKECLKLTFV